MDLPRTELSLDELTFFLYERPLHPELFNIYNSVHFFQGDYEVIIWITGCSHVVSVFYDSHCLTELICPRQQMLPRRGLLDKFTFRREKSHQRPWADDFHYMMNYQIENMSENLYRQSHKDINVMARKRGLLVSYAQWCKGEFEPFSYLDYEAHMDEFHLYTYHAFPEQQTILKTQSLFDMRKKS